MPEAGGITFSSLLHHEWNTILKARFLFMDWNVALLLLFTGNQAGLFVCFHKTRGHWAMQAQRWECFHFASWKAKDKLGPAMRKLDDGKAKYRAVLFKFP